MFEKLSYQVFDIKYKLKHLSGQQAQSFSSLPTSPTSSEWHHA